VQVDFTGETAQGQQGGHTPNPTLHLSPQRIWKHWTVERALDRVARVRTHGAKDGRDWVRCGTFSAVVG
jgi:hypothetical protein